MEPSERLACEEGMSPPVGWFVFSKAVTCLRNKSLAANMVKWNERGVNEWSVVKDTGAAVRNAEELQIVWQTPQSGAESQPTFTIALKVFSKENCNSGLVWHIYLLTTNDEHLFTGHFAVEWNGAANNRTWQSHTKSFVD
jgi:hypothetical protein